MHLLVTLEVIETTQQTPHGVIICHRNSRGLNLHRRYASSRNTLRKYACRCQQSSSKLKRDRDIHHHDCGEVAAGRWESLYTKNRRLFVEVAGVQEFRKWVSRRFQEWTSTNGQEGKKPYKHSPHLNFVTLKVLILPPIHFNWLRNSDSLVTTSNN